MIQALVANRSLFVSIIRFLSFIGAIASAQAQYTISNVAGRGLRTGIAATSTYLPAANGGACDTAGGFYFSTDNRVVHVNRIGTIDFIIGDASAGFAGDGGSATSSAVRLAGVRGLAVDGSNNLYIADLGNYRVRKVDASTGIIATVAGNGRTGLSGSGVPGINVQVSPVAITVDFGGLYISDGSHISRLSATTGIITTIAGNNSLDISGDGGLAMSAGLGYATAIAIDKTGNLFLATYNRIRRIDATSGIITTIAGNDASVDSGDGGPAINAGVAAPASLAVDSGGTVFISDQYAVRKLAPSGIISRVVGAGNFGPYSGEGGPASSASVATGGNLALDPAGNLLYVDFEDQLILQIDAGTTIIHTVAGTTIGVGDSGPATSALLSRPAGLAVDSSGNIYVADAGAFRVRKISAATGIITTVAGNGTLTSTGDGGLATKAGVAGSWFGVPTFPIALDASGNLYLHDNGTVRKVAVQTGIISTVAGGGGLKGPAADGGPATSADFFYVTDMTVTGTDLYLVHHGRGAFEDYIRKVDLNTGIISTIAPTAHPGTGFDHDSLGNSYFTRSPQVYRVEASSGTISSFAGVTSCFASGAANCPTGYSTGAQLGDGGPALSATVLNPRDVKIDRAGNLFIADAGAFRVRLVSGSTGIITTVAGTNEPACNAPQGPATSAMFMGPNSLALDSNGNVYVADPSCEQLYKLTPVPAYAGYLDNATCRSVSGWAADKNRLGQSISVNIYDGATLLATVTANQSRPDVGAILGDNGLHGFSYSLPATLSDGKAHTIRAVYETSTTDLAASPKTLTCGGGTNYAGYIDSASCTGITGWVADRNRPSFPITVSLWDGTTQISSTTANASRPDVGAVLGDNGLHGFSIPIPTAYANGTAHTLQVHYETSSTPVGGAFTLTCGGTVTTNYAGYIDSASCSGISGWVADRKRPNIPVTVTLWDGANQIAATTANASRPDVGAAINDNGLHGFSIPIPSTVANGVAHALQVRYETSSTQVTGAPTTLTCGSTGTNYAGWVDGASCNGITGWAADRNRLNQAITVSLWDGSTQVGSATANGSRTDVGAVIGDNGLHGFTLPIPAAYANGVSHSLQVHFETSASQLGSTATLTCGSAATNYAGYVDTLTCSSIAGWAADRNALNTTVNVNIYDGSTLLLTMAATGSRADVGAAIGDNGLHGFSVTTPTSLRDGKAHAITVRPGSSSAALSGQQQALTCQP